MNRLNKVFQLIDNIKFGETVLIEYGPSYAAEFITLALVKYARMRGYPIVIDDNFDSLHIVREHLKLFGIKENFEDALVVKTGGMINVGNVVNRISLESDPVIYEKHYERVGEEIYSNANNVINIVLGIEKLFAFVENINHFYTWIIGIQSFLGNNKRKSFYIIDKNVASILKYNPLPELERVASIVVEVTPEKDKGVLLFKKSSMIDLIGQKIKIPVCELL
ncbi:hypothetical protein PAP_01485 [Palaeococcus pacificus DY20341]|uniref:KaiC-like domain-containing protein n=1 Tax=Palaeococcus pacificus DY20341 TaxID=1343739 RepID=A0A075LS21_9EURY|nr:DUF257 family protein [Palaeococcus pacificus]AIF68737.1 hypothetical protein PAP_01485 [Palaeococcus pacificus DY20341]